MRPDRPGKSIPRRSYWEADMDTYMWWWIAASWLVGALMVGALWGAMVRIGRGEDYDDE